MNKETYYKICVIVGIPGLELNMKTTMDCR